MVNKKRLLKLAQNLIRIDSQNPPGDEAKIALFVKDYLKALGLKVKIFEFEKKRANILAYLEGKNKKRSLLVTPHLDTVPAGKNWKVSPFAGKIFKNRLYGLGATDCKGNLASAMEAMNSLVEDKAILDYNVILAATADEESGSRLGLMPLLERGLLRADAAVVLDADDFNVIVTQKGLIHLKVKIEGKRAHGAYPWLGINAIDTAIDILRDLKNNFPRSSKNKYLKPATLNIGTIKGGDKVNVVADWCEFELDFRFLPGESAKEYLRYLRKAIRKYTQKFTIEIQGIQQPYSIDRQHYLVHYFNRAMRRFGIKSRIRGSEGATVISFFQDQGIPAIATGFGVEHCAHAANEYVNIKNLYQGTRVLEEFLKIYRF